MSLRIVFAGTPDFAVPSLKALVAAGHEIVLVVTQPDRRKGRGRKLAASPVKELAGKLGLPVSQPDRIGDSETLTTLRRLAPDVLVIVAYGQILPAAVLEVPRLGCINVHASLLPRWRGAAPIAHAILSGDTSTGVSIMQMVADLDSGPVYRAEKIPISPSDTASILQDRLADLGAANLVKVIAGLERGGLGPVAQPDEGLTYAPRLKKSDARIDWSQPVTELERKVRAFNPWPVAETRLAGRQLRIWSARALPGTSMPKPGAVITAGPEGIDVATGDGILRVTKLQLPGGRPLNAGALVNSMSLDGVIFE